MQVPARRAVLMRLVQGVICIGLLAWLWQVADGRAALRHLQRADPVWLAAAFAALSLQTVLSALRWRLTAAQFGISMTAGHAVREYYLSQIVNQSLPGGMVGDAGRAVRCRAQAGLMASGLAVAFERLAGQAGLFVIWALAVAVTLALPGGLDWPAWLLPPVLMILGAGMSVPALVWLAARWDGRFGRAALRVSGPFARAYAGRRVLAHQVALSIATSLCNIGAFTFCAWAVAAPLGWSAALALVPLILFCMLIPLSVSGWGLREGAAVALLPLEGIAPGAALAASVAFGLTFLAAVLPALGLVLTGGAGRRGTAGKP